MSLTDSPIFEPSPEGDRFGKDELLRCSDGSLFGQVTPRLPAPPFLAFDEITWITRRGGIHGLGMATGCKSVADMGWIFEQHFLGDPIVPAALLLDGLLQLTGFFAGYAGHRGKGRSVRLGRSAFLAEVTPDRTELVYRIDVRKHVPRKALIIADGTVTVDGETALTAEDLWVMIKR